MAVYSCFMAVYSCFIPVYSCFIPVYSCFVPVYSCFMAFFMFINVLWLFIHVLCLAVCLPGWMAARLFFHVFIHGSIYLSYFLRNSSVSLFFCIYFLMISLFEST